MDKNFKLLKYLKILSGSVLYVISIAVTIIFNIILLFFPLTNVFGFEFSLLNAVLLTFLFGLISLNTLKNYADKPEKIKKHLYSLSSLVIFLLIIPLIISITNSLININCSLEYGFYFYLVITLPSVIIGAAIGTISYLLNKKFATIFFILLYLIIISIPLFEFYFNPQIYFFNPIFGFFPGTIYDEGLSVTSKLINYRLLNLFFLGGVLYIIFNYYFSNNKLFERKIILVISFLLPILFLVVSPNLGFSTTNSSLQKSLSRKVTTKHFVLHFPRQTTNQEIRLITLNHEYYYKKVTNYLDVKLEDKIESYVFFNSKQKGDLFGSANADVAKPWLLQIYTTENSYKSTLEHEIAHLVSSSFGSGILKLSSGFNPMLIEGIAVASSPYFNNNSISTMASLAYQNGYKINLKKYFNGLNFYKLSSSLSYIYGGAFSKYLIEKHGVKKYKLFYKNGDFNSAFNITFQKSLDNFYNSLSDKFLGKDSVKANYFFGRRTIFTKVCPRYISDRLKTASSEYSNGNLSDAKEIYKSILELTPNYYSILGLSDISKKNKDVKSGIKIITKYLDNFKNTAYYYNLIFKLADLYILDNKIEKAKEIYQKLADEHPTRWLASLAQFRLELLNTQNLLEEYINKSERGKLVLLNSIMTEKNVSIILPIVISISKNLNIEHSIFIKIFYKEELINKIKNSYTLYMLSSYLLSKYDYDRALKTIKMSVNVNKDVSLSDFLSNYSKKIEWIFNNRYMRIGNIN